MPASEYVKLTPVRRTASFGVISVTRSNLWLARDHLLCVETEGYTENYRRFYFRDIQAVIIRRNNNRALTIGAVTGAMVLFFAVIALAMGDVAGIWVFGGLSGICAIPFVLNLIYGPTCQCELRTAVQTEKLPSLSRVRRARRVLERIRPLIAEAQGRLTPEEVAARFREQLAAPGSEPPVMSPPEPAPASPESPQPT